MAAITRSEGTVYRHVASHGLTPDEQESAKRVPIELNRSTVTGRAVLERKIIHILDGKSDPDFNFAEGLKRIGFRTLLGVPLLREGQPIGVIVLMRKTVNAFSDNQGKAEVSGNTMRVGVKALSPGSYRVHWVDTHKSEGDFTFKVGGQ
jgi:two-component system, NtrC family, sensor kinase